MDCPVCKGNMTEEDFGGVMVDVCKEGCKGIWFDWIELLKLDESHEGAGQALAEALLSDRGKDDNRGKINCPKCSKPMVAHLYQSSKEITVDECYICGGFFLDAGELKIIKETFMSDDQRESYASHLVDAIDEYGQGLADLKKKEQRAAATEKMTRFLRPSLAIKKILNKE